MSERLQGLLIYIVKCTIGVLTVFSISSLIHYTNTGWSLISVLLVLSPEGKDAVKIALDRIKANVIGASCGLVCLLLGSSLALGITCAVALTLCACHLLKLDTASRSALAAAVIIMLRPEGAHMWSTAIERVIAVFAGCLLGLLITFIFHPGYHRRKNNIGVIADPSES